MSRYDELQKLQALKEQGALTEAEFELEKQRLLSAQAPPPLPQTANSPAAVEAKPWGLDLNLYCMLLHLSQLAFYALPVLGIVLPIIMWATKKDQFPEIDRHGRIVLNWCISAIIYATISGVLVFLFIGVPMLFVLGLIAVVFPIIGGLKANAGEEWRYPGSIQFL